MASICLQVSNWSIEDSCVMLNTIVNNYIKEMLSKKDLNLTRENILIFKWLLMFFEPNLDCHLTAIGFMPDFYAVSWFLNLFSST